MATSVTFNSLSADLKNYLERGGSYVSDPTVYNQIPRLINAAERNLAQFFKLLGQIEVLRDVTGLQNTVSVLTKPDRWRKTVSLSYGTGTSGNKLNPIFPRSYEYCRGYWPDASMTGAPEFYADYDIDHWLIVPTPDQTYPLEAILYMLPPLLDAANQSNFWSRLAPNALLYGSLIEASAFLKDDPRIPTWKDMYATQIATLNGQDLQRQLDRATQRDGT